MDAAILLLLLNKPRIDAMLESVYTTWDIEESVQATSKGKYLLMLKVWKDYLVLEKESLSEYGRLKRHVIDVFGEGVFTWLLNNTTYLTRSVILRKKGVSTDRVVQNMMELINLQYAKDKTTGICTA